MKTIISRGAGIGVVLPASACNPLKGDMKEFREGIAAFQDSRVHFVAGRLVPLHARLFANDIVFVGRKPS